MRTLTLLTTLAILGAVPLRQAGPPPVPAASGTGQIAGVIVDAQTRPQPVHRAIVTLTGPELPAGRAVMSDDQGHFSFDRLPAGHFTLAASKPAYVKATYGAVRPGGVGTPISLSAEQQMTDLRLTLPHGGAIAGVIHDIRGEPVPGIQVSVFRTNAPAGTVPLRGDAVTTDDGGAYRAFGLLPGTYVIFAAPGSSGGLGEIGQMSVSDIDATLARLRQAANSGRAPASTPRANAPSSIVRPTQPFSTAPVFYPGVTAASAAEIITLGLGEERTNIDFVYQLAHSAAVSGTVSGATTPSSVQVTLSPEGMTFQMPLMLGAGPMNQRDAAPGTFVFTNVTPGKYTLMARSGGAQPPVGALRGAPPPGSPQPVMFAVTTVEVSGDNIEGVALTLQPALHVSGRLVFQGTSMTPPADLTKIRVRLSSASPGGGSPIVLNNVGIALAAGATGLVQANGTFVIDGVLPGAYRISTIGEPGGWRAKSAMLGDRDILDTPIEIGTNDVAGVEISFSDQHSQLNGRILSPNGAPASRYLVVAFPTDRALWLPPSRRMKSARPGTDGQFRLDDLPAGEYYLAALTDADPDDWQSPAFLTPLVAASVKVSLGDGETKTHDLRVAK